MRVSQKSRGGITASSMVVRSIFIANDVSSQVNITGSGLMAHTSKKKFCGVKQIEAGIKPGHHEK